MSIQYRDSAAYLIDTLEAIEVEELTIDDLNDDELAMLKNEQHPSESAGNFGIQRIARRDRAQIADWK